ncbi:MAG: V-type ATP synthase subunit D [Sphaerochaetaceae bacterium]|jgi:V/A-type H+-transporting ATPase subunit D|nr:V-type ATP synthase subunit D [Sphaerochaetaceae bacterium]MDC7236907.1 V-type ATP synthase subunit D [Sphaerochaetaceae bacterium]MDC7249466.1 V-type ATP synthase subunit D [Sphaerochaetaceae bacterium]
MTTNLAPTRSNLMKLEDNLKFATLGYELLDQKRQILISELLALVDQAVDYQSRVDSALETAWDTLSKAIMEMGRLKVGNLCGSTNIEYNINVSQRKVMGVAVPVVETTFSDKGPYFSQESSNIIAELGIQQFSESLELMGRLAELKVSIMRLSREVKKTIRKVNALEKISIPETQETIKYMKSRIEESERESFILLKSVKDRLEKQKELKNKKQNSKKNILKAEIVSEKE